jgi:hypothetical protein
MMPRERGRLLAVAQGKVMSTLHSSTLFLFLILGFLSGAQPAVGAGSAPCFGIRDAAAVGKLGDTLGRSPSVPFSGIASIEMGAQFGRSIAYLGEVCGGIFSLLPLLIAHSGPEFGRDVGRRGRTEPGRVWGRFHSFLTRQRDCKRPPEDIVSDRRLVVPSAGWRSLREFGRCARAVL